MTQDEFKRLLVFIAGGDMFPDTEWATGVNPRGEPLPVVRELFRRIKPLDYEQAEAAVVNLRFNLKGKAITIGHINDALSAALAQKARMEREQREASREPAPEDRSFEAELAEDETLRAACTRLTPEDIHAAHVALIDRAASEFERRYLEGLDINKPGPGGRRFRRFALRLSGKATA